MNKLLLIMLITFISMSRPYAQGIGDWDAKTPGGNTMLDSGSGTVLKFSNPYSEIKGINKWYFFRGHIIGKSYDGFFVTNEHSHTNLLFHSESVWNEYLVDNNLKPTLWIRWYQDDWRFLGNAFMVFVFAITVIICFVLYLMVRWVLSKLNISLSMRKYWIMALLVTIVMLLLDAFPQSI
jgi:hypothetical protein